MKNTRKILVALLVVFTLLASLATITASAASQPETLYLTPNANWKKDNARFAAYFFGNGETWVDMKDSNSDGIYEVAVPTDKVYPSVIFCRMNPNAAANNWNNKWNQTSDLSIPTGGANHYTVKENTWDKGGGTWSTLGSTCEHVAGPEATCTEDQTCTLCGDTITSATGHNYDSAYKCGTCGGQATFTVAGTGAHLGTEWATGNTDNDMTYADGVYTKVYENVEAGTYLLKCACDHDWGIAYPDQNKEYTVEEDGSTVTVTLTGTTVAIEITAPAADDPTVDPDDPTVDPDEPTVDPDEPATETITVYFENNWLWTEVACYYWLPEDGGDNTWPGTAMTVVGTLDGHDVYSVSVPANVAGLIISGFKDTDPTKRDQTPDITEGIVDGAGWKMLWNEKNDVEAIEFAPSTDPDDPTVDPDDPTVDPDDPTVDPDDPTDDPNPAPTDYYLIGYLNGANYGCEEDWENLGEYKFVDGKLSTSFSKDSYVFIKTGDNAHWFLSETYCEDTTVTLKENLTEKMFVPGGVELNFTLTVNEDGSLTLSYTTGAAVEPEPEQPKPAPTDFYLVGYIGDVDYDGNDYHFVNGKLTATFTSDTYVVVKDNNGDWYLAAEYCQDTEVTLAKGNSEKMFVPKDVQVTFTLEVDEDGTLYLSYTTPSSEQPKPEDPKPEDPKPEDPKPEDPKPEDPQPENPQPEQPEEELGFFEAIWQAILDFFKSIGDFFAGLFGGNAE